MLAKRICGETVKVTVRYAIEPLSEVDVVVADDVGDRKRVRRLLARFGRRLEDELGTVTIAKWVLFDPDERTELEFPPAKGPGPAG
jgi:hypothetical protein